MTPTLNVTPGQRPFSAWIRCDEVGRGEDRVAALLGLDAGVGGPAVDRDLRVEDALPRRDDVAVRPGALEDEADVGVGGELADVRRRRRRADLLVGVRDERQPLEWQRSCRRRPRARRRGRRGGRTSCRSRRGRRRSAVGVDPERALGGGARVEDRVHVADEEEPWPPRLRAAAACPTIVDPKRPAGSGRASTSAPMSDRNAATNRPTSSTPCGRVGAAVDVDEPREVGEVGGLGGADGGVERGELGVRRRRIRARSRSPRWAVYGPRPLGILGGPCAWSRSACSRDPTSTGSSRWSRSRSRIGRRRTWYGQREPGRHAARPAGGDGPADGLAGPGRTAGRLGPAAARRPRRGPWRRRRPSLVGPGPLDRDVPVDRRGAGPHDRRGGGRPDGAGRRSRRGRPATVRRQARAIARWHATIADARTTPPAWIRDADRQMPVVSITGTNGKSTVTRLIDPHPRPRRAAGRDDDVRRRPRQRADGRARRLDRARRGVADPRPVRPRRRASSRPPAAGSCCGAWATSRTTSAS